MTETTAEKLSVFYKDCIRVFAVVKKPSIEEFKVMVKVTGVGVGIMGLIGFIMVIAKQYLWS